MANITIYVRDGITAKEFEAEVPDNVIIRDLLPAIANELRIESASGQHLINKSQNFEYDADDTLVSRDTQEKDICILTYEPAFGKEIRKKEIHKKKDYLSKEVKSSSTSILGIEVRDMPDLGYEQLLKNEGSIPLLIHRHSQLESLCIKQREEIDHLHNLRELTNVSTALFLLAQIIIAFGVNLITQKSDTGWVVLSAGVLILLGGLYFAFQSPRYRPSSLEKKDVM